MENIDLIEGAGQSTEIPRQKKKSGRTGAAKQTLYRIALRNQLRSMSIADQKANILIGINTVLISIIIAILGVESTFPGFSFVDQFDLNIPLLIFLLACFASGIIAVIAVLPNIRPWNNDVEGKVFFKNYRNITMDQFKEYMEDVVESAPKIYSSIHTDMFFLGRIVYRKFYLLRLAYVVYMIGLSGLVISFLLLRAIS